MFALLLALSAQGATTCPAYLYVLAARTGRSLPECADLNEPTSDNQRAPIPAPRRKIGTNSSNCDAVRTSMGRMAAMSLRPSPTMIHVVARCELETGNRYFGRPSDSVYNYRGASSQFGWRTHPISGKRKHHSGIDIPMRHGSPVTALAGGVVTDASWHKGYGKLVEIEHPITGMRTRYAHNSRLMVRTGDVVAKGQTIAQAGSTGASTGTHVHIEVRINSTAVNPRPYLIDPDKLSR